GVNPSTVGRLGEEEVRKVSSEEELKKHLVKDVYDKYVEMKNLKPVRSGEFIGVERDKFYVQLSEEEVYELSPLAYYIWALCDGEHSVEDITRDISENALVPLYQVVEPVLIVLEEMKKANLVSY
ncbi:MAG: PqqD family protein, partial [Desulfurococcaceae archaeon]